jgi:SAM-dependent methyltransferase
LESLIDRTPVLAGLNYAKGQLLYRLGLRGHHSGSTARAMSVSEALGYIRLVVDDYLRHGAGGDADRIHGKDILEIGPGDNLGVAVLLLAKGARSVTTVDGFMPRADPQHNARVYGALYGSLTDPERERVREILTPGPDGTARVAGARLRSLYGVRIDRDTMEVDAARYDIIVSRAVLEHVGDLEAGWRNMVRALRPGGEMWHQVDFRCHRLFEAIHPLYFLTIPEPIWRLVSRPDPTLNRRRPPTYRALLADSFAAGRFYVTSVLNGPQLSPPAERLVAAKHYQPEHVEAVESIRPRLLQPFRSCTTEDLLIAGGFIVAATPR